MEVMLPSLATGAGAGQGPAVIRAATEVAGQGKEAVCEGKAAELGVSMTCMGDATGRAL